VVLGSAAKPNEGVSHAIRDREAKRPYIEIDYLIEVCCRERDVLETYGTASRIGVVLTAAIDTTMELDPSALGVAHHKIAELPGDVEVFVDIDAAIPHVGDEPFQLAVIGNLDPEMVEHRRSGDQVQRVLTHPPTEPDVPRVGIPMPPEADDVAVEVCAPLDIRATERDVGELAVPWEWAHRCVNLVSEIGAGTAPGLSWVGRAVRTRSALVTLALALSGSPQITPATNRSGRTSRSRSR